jgi:hypothetical protein
MKNPVPSTSALLTITALLTALVVPAGAQTLAASSSTTVSAAALVVIEQARLQPQPRESRALAMAAFARPAGALPSSAFRRDRAAHSDTVFEARVLAKDEWSADDGLRVVGTRIAYKTRF